MEKYKLLDSDEERLPYGYRLLTVEEVLEQSKEITEFLAHDKNGSQKNEINGFELKKIFDLLKNQTCTTSSSTSEIEEEARAEDASTFFLVHHEYGSENVEALEMEFDEKDNIEGIPNICTYPLETLVQSDLVKGKGSTFSISISNKKGTLNLKLYKVNTNDNEKHISNDDEGQDEYIISNNDDDLNAIDSDEYGNDDDLNAIDSDEYDSDDDDEFDQRSKSFEENNTNKDMGMWDMIEIPNLSIKEEIPIGYKLVTIKELLLFFQNEIEVYVKKKTIDKGKSSVFLIIRRSDTMREGQIYDIQDFLGTYFSYESRPRFEHHKIRLKNGFIDKARFLVWKEFTRQYVYFQLAVCVARCETVKIESKVEDQVVAFLFACLFDSKEEIDAVTKVSDYFQILTMNNSNSIRGGCSLHLCAAEGKHETLNFLLNKLGTEERRRALAAKASANEETPLYMAVLMGQWRVVKLLCGREMEIDVNQTTKGREDTALMIAAKFQMEASRLWRPLLKRKDVRLDMVNGRGDTVLHAIADYSSPYFDSVSPATFLKELLKRCGCKVSLKAYNAQGRDELEDDVIQEVAACYSENRQHTWNEANDSHVINLRNHRNSTPLHAALGVRRVRSNDVFPNKDLVETIPIQFSRLLISAGADIYAIDNQGQNALHRACSSPKDSSTIKILLQCVMGESLEAMNSKFMDPKSRWKSYTCTQDLLGQTPLHLAAKYGNIDAIHLLLDPSKNELIDCDVVDKLIQMRDFNDQTILHYIATKDEPFDVQDAEGKKIQIQEFVCRPENCGSALPLIAWSVAEGKVRLADDLARKSGYFNLSIALKGIRENSRENLLGLALSLKKYDMAVELLNRGAIVTKQIHDHMEEGLFTNLREQRGYFAKKLNELRSSNLKKERLISSKNEEPHGNLEKERLNFFYEARQKQVEEKIQKIQRLYTSKDKDKGAHNVKRLERALHKILKHQKGRTTDQPTHEDLLKREDITSSISALLLNQHMGSPITLGILGSTGMGKSSMMLQVENYLLSKAAREAVSLAFPTSPLEPHTHNNFTGAKTWSDRSTRRGIAIRNALQKMIPQIKHEEKMFDENQAVIDLRKGNKESSDWKACLFRYLSKSAREVHAFLTSKLKCKNPSKKYTMRKIEDCISEFHKKDVWLIKRLALASDGEEVPNIMTVRFNAWHYQNRDEAWAGLAVEILKAMESCMTRARLFHASFMYSYRKNPSNMVVKVIIPSFVYLIIGGILAWVSFTLLSIHDNPILKKFGYTSIPISALASLWRVLGQMFTYAKPISERFIETTKSLQVEHLSKLGYQHRVIEDINFLKDQLTCRHIPWLWLWGFFAWIFNITSASTFLVDGVIDSDALKYTPQSKNFRVIVFIDNLDRRKEKLFTPLNIILKACDINAVVAIDKESVEGVVDTEDEEATPSKDHEETLLLKDTLLQQLIQIPIVLPEPDVYDLRKHFLVAHLKDFSKGVNKEMGSNKNTPNNQFQDVSSTLQVVDNLITREDFNKVDEGEGDEKGLKKDDTSTKNDEIRKSICSGPHNSIEVKDPNEVNKGEADTPIDNDNTIPSDDTDENIEEAKRKKIWQEMKVNVLDSNYNSGEIKVFKHLVKHTYGYYRSPRAWKSLLNYHRLIRSLITYNHQHAYMSAWKPQLVIWVFVCWQWRKQMNEIFKNWLILTAFPLEELREQNLLIDSNQLLDLKNVLKSASQASLLKQDRYKTLWDSINAIYPTLLKAIEKHIKENTSQNKVQEETTKKDKPSHGEMETMKAVHTSNSSDLHGEDSSPPKHEFKKESQNPPLGKQEKEETSKEEADVEWARLFNALKKGRYDVTMQGIQIFQNFRFDCDPGNLKLHVK